MAVLVDTSVLIDSERRGQRLDVVAGEAERAISVITASELLHGVHRAADVGISARRRAFVEHVLGHLEPIPITMRVARSHAEVWAHLRGEGELIGVHDLWIAATALAHGLRLATADRRHFQRVPGLDVLEV